MEKSKRILKFAALTHGIPRKEYEKGFVREALNKAVHNYEKLDGIKIKML